MLKVVVANENDEEEDDDDEEEAIVEVQGNSNTLESFLINKS